MNLKCDIRSHMHSEVIYGRQGSIVKVITDDGQVCIVEDREGKRFPCSKDKLSETPVERKQEPVQEPIIINKGNGKKMKAKVANNTLF